MNEVSVRPLSMGDADSLFDFETENRAYFERIGLPRGAAYYDRAQFQGILETLVAEQKKGLHYMYLVFNAQGMLAGRVNLTDVVGEPLRKAELGYRIGELHQGKGYATAAVRLVAEQAASVHGLHRLEAGTAPQNIGSQIVLIKNGFQFVGRYSRYAFQGDGWVDSLLFEKVLD